MQKLLSAASSTALIIALICIWAAAGGGGLHANEGFCTVFCLCLGEFLHSEQVVFMLHEVGGWFTEKGKGKKKHAALGIAGPLRHKTSRESHECSVCQDWLYTEKKEKDRHHHRQVVRALRIHSSTSKDSVMAFPREYIILGEFLGVFYSFRLRGSAYRAQTAGNIFDTFLASESSRLLSYPVRKRKYHKIRRISRRWVQRVEGEMFTESHFYVIWVLKVFEAEAVLCLVVVSQIFRESGWIFTVLIRHASPCTSL